MSRSNLCKSFYGCLGRGFWGPWMPRELIVSNGWFPAMLPPKLKFKWGDGIEAKGGLVSGGLRGLEPPIWASGKSKNAWSSSWKSARFKNSKSLEVSKWSISMMGRQISEIVSIIISLMLEIRVSPSLYGWVLLRETQDIGICYIIGIWPRDLR